MINCIVLAGKSKNILQGETCKALIRINNRPMISYVIDALGDSGVVGKIVIVGDIKSLKNIDLTGVETIIDDRGSIIDNVLAGLDYFKKDTRILITTCDIPLLTGHAVKDFVEKALKSKADICYPIIRKEVSESKYPDAKRTYAKLKEGKFTGGNLFIVNPSVVDRCIETARQMVEHRKNPMKMSRVFGIRFLLKFLLGRLTIDITEKRAAKILNIQPKAIVSHYPEIGNDVDKIEDIDMVKKYLEYRKTI